MNWLQLKLSTLCSIKNVKWPYNKCSMNSLVYKGFIHLTCYSRVMTDELASAKAFYTMQYQECQVA